MASRYVVVLLLIIIIITLFLPQALSLTKVFLAKRGNHNFPMCSTRCAHLLHLGELQTIVSQNSGPLYVEVASTFRRTLLSLLYGENEEEWGKLLRLYTLRWSQVWSTWSVALR